MDNEKILTSANQIYEEAKAIRRHLHQNPELGNQEIQATHFIKQYLQTIDVPFYQPLKTGGIAFIQADCPCRSFRDASGNTKRTKKIPVIAFRADIDALPITEQTGLSCASANRGIMHACGHDIHTAALLAAAKIIQAHKDELKTNVVLIFQPDEEGSGGAQRLIDAGIFKKYNIRKVFGMHVRSELDTGTN